MNEMAKQFDWLGFAGREIPIVALAIWWLIERVQKHDAPVVIMLYGLVFVILTVLNYLKARRR
jgi:hypothetical protein